jgi:hypothetical protein
MEGRLSGGGIEAMPTLKEEKAELPKCKSCGKRQQRLTSYVWRRDRKAGTEDVWCVPCYFKEKR